jgi:hypothetical protein
MALSDIEKVRLLIGAPVTVFTSGGASTTISYTDDEIQAFLDLWTVYAGTNDQYYMAAYLGLKALASRFMVLFRSGGTSVKIGDFETSIEVGAFAKSLLDQAEGYRVLVEETPAFAIAEENLSMFNELIIIRNWIYRTQLP